MPRTNKQGRIQKSAPPDEPKMVQLLKRMQPEIERVLPKHMNVRKLERVTINAMRATPRLFECTPYSFLGCLMECASLGLEPNGPQGHAFLIPRHNKRRGVTECTFLLGYKGITELAWRSGQLQSIRARVVHEGDDFEYYEAAPHPVFRHRPMGDGFVTHAYMVAVFKDGAYHLEVLDRAQIEERRARSQAGETGPWRTDFDAMARKSVVRAAAPWLPSSPELARGLAFETAFERDEPIVLEADHADVLKQHGILDDTPPETDEPEHEQVLS